MVFEVNSKFEVWDKVKLSNQMVADVLDIKLDLFDNYYRINYLLEFSNRERRWMDETSIYEKVEE